MKKLLMMLAISLVMVACKKDETEIDPKKLSVEDSYYEINPTELIGTYWVPAGDMLRYEIFDTNGKYITSSYALGVSGSQTRTVMKFDENTVQRLIYVKNSYGIKAWYEDWDYTIDGNKVIFHDESTTDIYDEAKGTYTYTMFNGDMLLVFLDSFIAKQDFTTEYDVEVKKGSLVKSYGIIAKTQKEKYQQTLDYLNYNNVEIKEDDDNDGHIHL